MFYFIIMKTWRIINAIVLGILVSISIVGTFFKHISWGWGLGDLLAYGFLYFITIIHFVLTIRTRSVDRGRNMVLSIVFFCLTVLFCLKATIWRGGEYRWNGKIFYDTGA